MFKVNIKNIKYIKVKIFFFKFNISYFKNKLVSNLSLNNKLVKSKKFNFKKSNNFIDKIFDFFIEFFYKKNIKFNLLIFEFYGINFKIKKEIKTLITKFLYNINFQKGFLIFLEKTLISFNGSKKSKKRRKKVLKKKRNIYLKKLI